MKDAISVARLEKLHPNVQNTFKEFIEECEHTLDITLRIIQGLRTFAEQDALYAQGRTVAGSIVTHSRGGQSYHNYGLAIDLAVVQKDGKIDWNYDMGKLKPIATKYGIEWGGDWENFKDRPHFQLTKGYTFRELLAKVQDKKVDEAGYVLV